MLTKNVTLLVATMMMSLMADQLAGNVQKVDEAKGCISVEGVKVSVANAAITGKKDVALTLSAIKKGSAVIVDGVFADGKIEATTIKVIKKVKKGVIEGTVESINPVVRNIVVNGVKIQVGDNTSVEALHGRHLALNMIQPGAHIICEGEWQDGKLFYAKKIVQTIVVEASAKTTPHTISTEVKEEAIVDDPINGEPMSVTGEEVVKEHHSKDSEHFSEESRTIEEVE